MMFLRNGSAQNPVREALRGSRGVFVAVALFSALVNILGLTGSFYMLQVYDRVLASRSVETLVAISLLAVGLFSLQGVLEIVRVQAMTRIGVAVERALLRPVHDLVMRLPLFGRPPAEISQPVRDMEALRMFAGGPAPLALLDLPWMPLYLLLIWVLHPWLGLLTLGGMIVLSFLTLMTERSLQEPNREATVAQARRQQVVETTRRHAEVLRAMGFGSAAARRFFDASAGIFAANRRISDVSGTLATLSRSFRTMLQSAILGLGAYLVIRGQMSGGAIIAASILSGRALQPVEMVIAHWKQFVAARQAHARLGEAMRLLGDEPRRIDLPLAHQVLGVENISVGAPGSRHPIVAQARFQLKAGDGLAVIGPSGAGKSTLARALVGAIPVLEGTVRLDGAPLGHWPEASLGRLIGYLPQEIDLFDGTVAENIARLDPDADDEAVLAAAKAANVHDLVLRLPQGYATMLGEGGVNLSIGQRQRIGLARALYRDPFLVVLDEPNAHLDGEGEQALTRAVAGIRARGGIVVAVSHRREIVGGLSHVVVVADGRIQAFGERDAILRQLAEAQAGAQRGARPVVAAPISMGAKASGALQRQNVAPGPRADAPGNDPGDDRKAGGGGR